MNINFEWLIQRNEKNLNDKGYNLRANVDYIENVIDYVKLIANEYPELSSEELKKTIHHSLNAVLEEYDKNAFCRKEIAELNVCNEILQDNSYIDKVYNKVKDEEVNEDDMNFSSYEKDIDKVKENYIKSFLASIRRNNYTPTKLDLFEIEIYDMIKNKKDFNISKQDRDKIEFQKIIMKGNEKEKLKFFITENKRLVEENLKEKYISLMVQSGDFLRSFGLLERYCAVNETYLRRFGLEELGYNLEEDKENKDAIGLENIFEEEYLKTLELEELAMLNTFWQNRFAKDSKAIAESIFYIDTLKLWDDIKNNREIDLENTDVMNAVFLKTKVMNYVGKGLLDEATKNNNPDEISDDGVAVFNIADQVDDLENKIGRKYKKYFDKILPQSENDFLKDASASAFMFSNIENVYYCKDSTLASLLSTFMTSKKIKNWGIMNEKQNDSKKNKYVLIGIDYEGFNMPLRVHMRKDDLIDKLESITANTIIPMYEGEEDFRYNDDIIKTQLFMPLDKRHKVIIREKSKNIEKNHKNYKFIKHLDFLRKEDDFPEHLKENVVEGKKTVRKRVRKYVDVKTGQLYIMNKKNYIPVENDGDKNNGNNRFEDDSR